MQIRTRGGQVLLMVTFALITMCGMLGLAVDLGWSYFVKKSAQTAADSAALAAVRNAANNLGPVGPFNCGDAGLTCAPVAVPCLKPNPGLTNIDQGCLYAERNGFTQGGNGGRQTVTMEAGVTSPPPTAPGVFTQYWVTTRVAESVPQLFSAILGNTSGTTSARATAALVKSAVNGSLILLNRQNDCVLLEGGAQPVCGVDLLVQANDNQGTYALQVESGGILMASKANGTASSGRYAGENQGGGTVFAPFTHIRDTGSYVNGGSSAWIRTPENGQPDGRRFQDPMKGMYQPPPPPVHQVPAAYPLGVVGGTIIGSDDPSNPTVLQPGAYYASAVNNKTGQVYATGDPICISGYVEFSTGNDSFAEYVFFGGISAVQQGQGATHFQFAPGRYLFAGAKPKNNGDPASVFDITTNLAITDATSPFVANTGPAGDPGEIFIFTDANYVGYDWTTKTAVPLQVPALVEPIKGSLKFGISGFQAGNNTSVMVNLHGINKQSPLVPATLRTFDAPILVWQDQNNSVVKYYENRLDPTSFKESCVTGDAVVSECVNTLDSSKSPELFFKASPGSSLFGVIYQPRGAWTTVGGGSGYSGPLQIVTGSFNLQGNANLRLLGTNDPILQPVVALVE